MSKTAGGVRGGFQNRTFSNDARSMFNDIESGYGRKIDYSAYDAKKLQSLQRVGRSYNPAEKEGAIKDYESYANRRLGSKYLPITHAELSGARSELISVAHRAAAYRNLDAISEELRRRKR